MLRNFEDVQKIGKTNIEATTEAFGTLSNTSQAIAAEMMEYSKRSYENSTKTLEKLFGVKSLDKAIEVIERICQVGVRRLFVPGHQAWPILRRSGQGGLQTTRSSV